MSAKNVDKYNRFRSITVAFRVSPEEQKELNRAIALSGLPKQEYCYRKCIAITFNKQLGRPTCVITSQEFCLVNQDFIFLLF